MDTFSAAVGDAINRTTDKILGLYMCNSDHKHAYKEEVDECNNLRETEKQRDAERTIRRMNQEEDIAERKDRRKVELQKLISQRETNERNLKREQMKHDQTMTANKFKEQLTQLTLEREKMDHERCMAEINLKISEIELERDIYKHNSR